MRSSTKIFLIIFSVLLILGLGSFLLFYIAFMSTSGDEEINPLAGDRIAVVELDGVITTSEEVVRQFRKYKDDNSIRAIVFRIDSPGGAVAPSQEIFREVKKVRDAGIPIVVSMGSVAASGGYYVACGASAIVANPGTLTGSIGVISQFYQLNPLMDKLGVGVNTIKSGRMKDAGNPFRTMTDEDKEYFQTLMDQVHRQFVGVVETERGLSHEAVVKLADGRVFTGEEAYSLHLVDTLGTYEDAIAFAAEKGGIKGRPSLVRERKRKLTLFSLLTQGWTLDELIQARDQIVQQPILQYRMVPGL